MTDSSSTFTFSGFGSQPATNLFDFPEPFSKPSPFKPSTTTPEPTKSRLEALAEEIKASSDLLKAKQEEFDREVTKEKARQRVERELDTSKRAIIILRKQAAREIANINKQKELTDTHKEQWDLLHKKLTDCEAILQD
jgi:hypothetical protein